MTSVHVPSTEAGAPSPCHAHPLSGGPARVWCPTCGRTYQAAPAEVGTVPDASDPVADAAARRAHELELERIRRTPPPPDEAPITPQRAAAHRRVLAEAVR